MIRRNLLLIILMCQAALASGAHAAAPVSPPRWISLPERTSSALSGSAFILKIKNMPLKLREKIIVEEILKGNIPDFQRQLVPIERKIIAGPYKGKTMRYWVLPDYLAIGSNADFIRVPLNRYSIAVLGEKLNLSLPTTLMVDDIYAQAQVKLKPMTLPAGKDMCGVPYFKQHNSLVQDQLQSSHWTPGMLVAGHKKDIVQSLRLTTRPEAIAIYGWHEGSHSPIQPLSTVHGAEYVDYSHGVRFVSNIVEVNNTVLDLRHVLSQRMPAKVAAKSAVDSGPHS